MKAVSSEAWIGGPEFFDVFGWDAKKELVKGISGGEQKESRKPKQLQVLYIHISKTNQQVRMYRASPEIEYILQAG